MPRRADGPLAGVRVLVTRPRHQSAPLVERLESLGAVAVELSMIDIAPPEDFTVLDAAISRLSQYDWVIFTSANGVTAFFKRFRELGRGTEALRGVRVGAIGPATAAALASSGVTADFVPREYVAEAIVAEIGDVSGQRILLPRADIARKALADELRAKGAKVDEITAYRTVAATAAAEQFEEIFAHGVDVVTFLSSSTVRNFLSLAGPHRLNDVLVACIGPITAQTAREFGVKVDLVADQYTMDGLVDAITRRLGASP